MSDWPQYESHKVVQAAQIIWIDRDPSGKVLGIQVRPIGSADDGQPFWPTVEEMAQKAEVGGWAILYSDGFKSISPAKVFLEGYTPVVKP